MQELVRGTAEWQHFISSVSRSRPGLGARHLQLLERVRAQRTPGGSIAYTTKISGIAHWAESAEDTACLLLLAREMPQHRPCRRPQYDFGKKGGGRLDEVLLRTGQAVVDWMVANDHPLPTDMAGLYDVLVGRHQPCIRFAKGVPDNLEEVFALLEHKLQQQLVSAKEQQQQQRCPSAARLDGSTKQPGSTTQRQAANMWDADVAKWCRRYCSKLHELEEAALAVAKRLADAHNPA